jgi:predicted Zn-dependent peptidase
MLQALLFTFISLSADETGIRPLPTGISFHMLDNGMKVILIEKPSLPMIGVNVVVKTGSAYESFATSGMSHMLEHLLFNGTDKMNQKELYEAVDKIGGYNNANTDRYYTNYMMVTPTENIEKGMEIQAGMLFHSTMPEKKFEKEKGIVMEEIGKSLVRPEEQMERNKTEILFRGHALSLPTLGTYETIKGMKRDDVYSFYKNYYVPNNMIMSVIGNFSSAEMLQKIKKIYGEEKPGNISYTDNPDWATGLNRPVQNKIQDFQTFHRFYSGKTEQLQFFYPLSENLNSSFFAMLEKNLDEIAPKLQSELEKSFPDEINSLNFEIIQTPIANFLQLTLVLGNQSNMNAITNNLNRFMHKQKFGLPAKIAEAEAIKNKTFFLKQTEKPHMFGIMYASTIAEKGADAILDAYDETLYKEASRKLSEFKITTNPFLIFQHPAKKSGKESHTNIETKIVQDEKGKPVIIVRKIDGSNLLAIHFLIKHKAPLEKKYGKEAANIWHEFFGMRMKSPEKATAGARFGFTFTVNDNPWIPMDNIYLHPDFGYIRVEGLGNDIEGAIEYLTAEMLSFKPTEEEFQKVTKKMRRFAMMGGGNTVKKQFTAAWEKLIYEENTPNDHKPLTFDNLLQFGKEYFSPDNMIISVASSATPENVKNYFSGFAGNSSAELQQTSPWYQKLKIPAKEDKIVKDSGADRAYLFYGFVHRIKEEEKPALQVLSLLLNDEIVFDIREKQGMAYHMSAGIKTIDDKALFYINMGTLPQNVEKLVPQFPAFFTPRFAAKIDEDKVTVAINRYLGKMMFRRLSSINQAYYLGYSYYFNKDISADETFLNQVKNVSPEEVRTLAKKYLDNKNSVQVIFK